MGVKIAKVLRLFPCNPFISGVRPGLYYQRTLFLSKVALQSAESVSCGIPETWALPSDKT